MPKCDVLYFEDRNSEVKKLKLNAIDFQFIEVSSLSEGIRLLQSEQHFDLVLYGLPAHESFDLSSIQMLFTYLPHLPLVLVIDPGQEEIALQALEQGVQDYWYRNQIDLNLQSNGLVPKYQKRVEFLRNRLQSLEELEQRNATLRMLSTRTGKDSGGVLQLPFLSRLSYEVRTPLQAIMGMSELLLETKKLDERQFGYLKSIQRSSLQLLDFLNNLLEFNKIQNSDLVLSSECLPLEKVLFSIARSFESACEAKKIDFVYSIDSNLPEEVMADGKYMRQMLSNVLTNAVHYTGSGSVTFRAKLGAKKKNQMEVIFYISDTGIGIPKDKLHLIFSEKTLGLPIAKKIAEAMGGSIQLFSELGVGTQVEIRALVKPKDPDAISRPLRSLESDLEVMRPLRILIAEDSVDHQFLLETFFEDSFHHIDFVSNGKLAVQMMQEVQTYDLVLMDISMPIMDGYEATQKIRAWELEQNRLPVPIIALTACSFHDELNRIRQVGCDSFLVKPIRKEALFSSLAQISCKKG